MASSRVIMPPSSSSAIYSPDQKLPSAFMDDILRKFYAAEDASSTPSPKAEGDDAAAGDGEVTMTLEDFLARSGAVSAEDVRVPLVSPGFGVDPGIPAAQFAQHSVSQLSPENPVLGFGDGSRGRGGRGRKRAAMEPGDRAAVQRQKRMIKNRESAARSRERKQAYKVELETLVTKLEEENARLLREQEEYRRMQEECKRKRFEELMENLIPVTEKKKPPHALQRTLSAKW